MRCPSCGGSLGEMDLLSGACQKCGDILLPDDVDKLRGEMGIAGPAPPEVVAPVIQSEPDEIPDSVDCPGCNTPLMGEDLTKWNAGACPYCSHINDQSALPLGHEDGPGATPPPSVLDPDDLLPEVKPDARPTPPEPDAVPAIRPVPMIINVGPMVGQVIDVPVGVPVGRKDLFGLLPDPWYEKHLKRVSGEHFELAWDSERSNPMIETPIGIIDLGSSNGSYVGGNRVTGTDPTPIGYVDINIGGNIQLSRDYRYEHTGLHDDFTIHSVTHEQSGIRVSFPGGTVSHLGRMTEEGEMERWAAMADLQLRAMGQDDTILAYLSRRHFTVRTDKMREDSSIVLDVFDGKEQPEVTEISEGQWKIELRKNSFIVSW